MNFNIVLLLFLVVACGVKGDPTSPKNQPMHSLLENYPDITTKEPLNDTRPIAGPKRR